MKLHQAQITASTLNDLSDANIRTRLKLGENQPNSRRSSTNLSQKRASRRQSGIQSPTSPTSPTIDEQQDEFVEASETLPTPPVPTHQQFVAEPSPLEQQQQQEEEQKKLQKQKEEEEYRKRVEEQQRQAAAAAAAAKAAKEEEARQLAAEREAKRLEQERILKEKQEAERKEEEKRILQRKLLEAEKNKGVILSGFVSVQPSTSPVSFKSLIMNPNCTYFIMISFGDVDILFSREEVWHSTMTSYNLIQYLCLT